MAKQLEASIEVGNGVTPLSVSFFTELITIVENDSTVIINYFGNPLSPSVPVQYPVSETFDDLVAAANDGGTVLVEVTAWASNATASKRMAVPYAGDAIRAYTSPLNSEINSKIEFRGNVIYVEETESDLADAANAGGGGGGETLFALTGTNTATGNVIGDINGNSLSVRDGVQELFTISAEEQYSTMKANNTTGSGNLSSYSAYASNDDSSATISSKFNGNESEASIELNAETGASAIEYNADSHSFDGRYGFDGDGGELFHNMGFDGNKWYATVASGVGNPEVRLEENALSLLMGDSPLLQILYDAINEVVNVTLPELGNYADDAAAEAAHVPIGGLYRTASAVKVRVA